MNLIFAVLLVQIIDPIHFDELQPNVLVLLLQLLDLPLDEALNNMRNRRQFSSRIFHPWCDFFLVHLSKTHQHKTINPLDADAIELHSQYFVGETNLQQIRQLLRVHLTLQVVHLAMLDLHETVGDLQLQVFDIQIGGVFKHFGTPFLRVLQIIPVAQN